MPLFAPLIEHLRGEGWDVRVTARDFAQTLDLVRQYGLDAVPVGRHAGRNKLRKVANLPVRALQLVDAVRQFRPHMALSHGSRTQAIAARLMRVPQVVMFDYEWTELRILSRLAWKLLCPSAVGPARLAEVGIPVEKVQWYAGLKEEIYLRGFQLDPGFRSSLGIGPDERLVTIRPPGLIGNYHDDRSEVLCGAAIAAACALPNTCVVILPKTRIERQFVESVMPASPAARVIVPETALPGLQLLAHSSVAISGGGTMNRESALLGVPTYSIFTGRRGAVDEDLARRGWLTFLDSVADISAIEWDRPFNERITRVSSAVYYEIIDTIHKLVSSCLRTKTGK